jgi:hypothetical protein
VFDKSLVQFIVKDEEQLERDFPHLPARACYYWQNFYRNFITIVIKFYSIESSK